MKAVVLKCRPNSEFHFGVPSVDQNSSLDTTSVIFHSDTLFSAIINTVAKVFPDDVELFINLFGYGNYSPKIKVSSGFYCIELQGKMIYFLPKPIDYNLEITDNHKLVKKVMFVSTEIWKQNIRPIDWEKKAVILQDKFVVSKEEWQNKRNYRVYHTNSVPKVHVHKPDKEDSIFYQTNLIIADGKQYVDNSSVHFYFLLEEELNEEDKKKLLTILNLLPIEGIGGERSSGCGKFENIEFRDDFPTDFVGNRRCSVSLSIPQDISEFKQFQYYNLVTRGGRNIGFNNQYLKKVKMILEGAVIESNAQGSVVDISPQSQKDYLRYGRTFSLPIT